MWAIRPFAEDHLWHANVSSGGADGFVCLARLRAFLFHSIRKGAVVGNTRPYLRNGVLRPRAEEARKRVSDGIISN